MTKQNKPIYCVITKIDPGDTGVSFFIKNKDKNCISGFEELSLGELDGYDHKKITTMNTQVFQLGEIIILDEELGREIGGLGRAPRKWFSEHKEFDNLEDAIKCSRKATAH